MSAPLSIALARRIIDGRAPDEVIHRNGNPMFERWWLLRTPSSTESKAGNIYLHRWLRSDAEDPHDHPWWNETTVLSGRLVEELFCPARIRLMKGMRRELTPGMSAMRAAEEIHRVVEVEPGTITLFVTGRKAREWGFWLEGRFIPWREYHGFPPDMTADYRAGRTALERFTAETSVNDESALNATGASEMGAAGEGLAR